MSANLQHVSLFSGVGGVDLAFERAGVGSLAACEIDKAARGVLADRFPDTHLFTDVTELTAHDLINLGADPGRTILSAGWPCQGNSVAGRREGMADARSGLWSEAARLLDEFRPAWFVGENVPGLLSVNGGRDFAVVLDDLGRLGYGFAWRVLDAQHFGVPQRRRRVILVGHLGDAAGPVEVLLEPEGVPGDSDPGITSGAEPSRGAAGGTRASGVLGTVAHTLTGEGFDASEDGTGRGTPVIAYAPETAATITAGQSSPGVSAPGRRQEDDTNLVAFHMTQSPIAGAVVPSLGAKSGGQGVMYAAKTASALDTQQGGPDDNAAQGGHLVATFQKITRPASSDHPDVWAERDIAATPSPFDLGSETRAVELVLAPTLTASLGEGGWAGHNREDEMVERTFEAATTVRRLTPVECERLQGFPDDWTITSNGKPQADSPRYKQMGNAVAVPVLTWVARRIAAHTTTGATP